MHRNAHNDQLQKKRGDLLTFREMDVRSQRLGITGKCDIVEFHRSSEGVTLAGCTGLWIPFPIEHKRGKPAAHTHADELQLYAYETRIEHFGSNNSYESEGVMLIYVGAKLKCT